MRGQLFIFKRCETGLHSIQPSHRNHCFSCISQQLALDHTALCCKHTTFNAIYFPQLLVVLAFYYLHRPALSSCMSQHTHGFDRCYILAQFQLSFKAQIQAFLSGYLSSLAAFWNKLMHIIYGNTPATRHPISLHSLVVPPRFAELSAPIPIRLAPLLGSDWVSKPRYTVSLSDSLDPYLDHTASHSSRYSRDTMLMHRPAFSAPPGLALHPLTTLPAVGPSLTGPYSHSLIT